MKKMIKPFILILVFLFLGLYLFYNNGYYETKLRREKELMDEMVIKYEEDLKKGIDVSKNDYTIEKADYSNPYTRLSLKVSKRIENIVDGSIKYVFKKINQMVND